MSVLGLVRRVASKSPRTILFRGWQEFQLIVFRKRNGWGKLNPHLNALISKLDLDEWCKSGSMAVFATAGRAAFLARCTSGLLNTAAIAENATRVRTRQFTIFGENLPVDAKWPWSMDWRTGYEWRSTYFRNYKHKAAKSEPREVKFPWELSRLTFLPALLQAHVIDPEAGHASEVSQILADWDERNPVAHSVNWYPMEAAMRGIQLCLLADMARQCNVDRELLARMFRMLAEHGEFIRRTIEFTDDAGNHYVAELVALLLIGRALHGFYPPADHWFRFAASRLGPEIMRQILPDGVDFEKSTAYHRLVLDLFMLAALCLERAGMPLGKDETDRLRAAAEFNAMFIRPDRLCPLVGDSDDAVVFDFDLSDTRDHSSDIAFASLSLGEPEFPTYARFDATALPWFFGEDAPATPASAVSGGAGRAVRFFPDGGFVIAKSEQHYFFADVGEVGQNGLGGHGHNDLLSFELFLGGQPVIVDPGCYLYSGDYAAHDRFRSTAAHNTLQVDDEEMAPFKGPFRISNRARPVDVSFHESNGSIELLAGHTGYESLEDPVRLRRHFSFDLASGRLTCRDRLSCGTAHTVTRHLHFAPGIRLEDRSGEVRIFADSEEYKLLCDARSQIRIVDSQVSPLFGQLVGSQILRLETNVDQDTDLKFEISPA